MERNVIVNKARYDIIPDNKSINKGKATMCITTGEIFKSAKEAAEYFNIPYVYLIMHLNGKTKTCHGMQFCYIAEMSYKANDIASCIIEMKQHMHSYDFVEMMKVKEENEAVKKENKELKEKLEKCLSVLI